MRALHGTNQPNSIGHFVSYGCIRMFNEDIQDLIGRVSVGAWWLWNRPSIVGRVCGVARSPLVGRVALAPPTL